MRLDRDTEADLIRKAKAGDSSAAQALVLANRHLARAAAARLHHHDPDDVEQECLIAIYNAIRPFDPSRDVRFTSYAGRCVHNALVDLVRRGRPRERPVAFDDDLPAPEPPVPSSCRQRLPALLDTLPRDWRRLLELLHGLNGHSPHTLRRAALALNISTKTAHRWHEKAMERLKGAALPSRVSTREPANA